MGKSKSVIVLVSYPWQDNSCYLDTSLELLFRLIMRGYDDFAERFGNQHSDARPTLTVLHEMFKLRKIVDVERGEQNPSEWLKQQRNHFRIHLKDTHCITSLTSYENLWVSLHICICAWGWFHVSC